MIAGNFEPGFFVEHFIKDMGIALAEARRMNLSLPGLALAEQLYVALGAQGHGRKGTQALMLALASLSEVDWSKTSGLQALSGAPALLKRVGASSAHNEMSRGAHRCSARSRSTR